MLFREGDRGYDFIVILAGAVTVVDHQAGVARELASGGPGEFVAELNILTGERLFTTAVVKEPGSILAVPVDRLQEVIAQEQVLADLILQTTFRRRQWLLQERAGSVKRVASAVGEGSIAIRFVSEYLGRRGGLSAAGSRPTDG